MPGFTPKLVQARPDFRFCVVGWTADENLIHEARLSELGTYAVNAVGMGLAPEEIVLDILDASGTMFEGVDVSVLDAPTGRLVSIVAVAAGRSACIADAEAVEPARLRA